MNKKGIFWQVFCKFFFKKNLTLLFNYDFMKKIIFINSNDLKELLETWLTMQEILASWYILKN